MNAQTDIARDAYDAFGERKLADAWLDRPSPLYAGRSPRQAAADPEQQPRVRRQLSWLAGHRSHQPVEPELHEVLCDPIIHLALAIIEGPRAGTDTSEVETQCCDASLCQSVGNGCHYWHFHRSASRWVGMADDTGREGTTPSGQV